MKKVSLPDSVTPLLVQLGKAYEEAMQIIRSSDVREDSWQSPLANAIQLLGR
jgi:hypothetical protein